MTVNVLERSTFLSYKQPAECFRLSFPCLHFYWICITRLHTGFILCFVFFTVYFQNSNHSKILSNFEKKTVRILFVLTKKRSKLKTGQCKTQSAFYLYNSIQKLFYCLHVQQCVIYSFQVGNFKINEILVNSVQRYSGIYRLGLLLENSLTAMRSSLVMNCFNWNIPSHFVYMCHIMLLSVNSSRP